MPTDMTFEDYDKLATEVKLLLNGQIIENEIIVDAFLTPNDWETAKTVYEFRKDFRNYPFNHDHKFGIVVVLTNQKLIDLKTINTGTYLTHLEEAIATLSIIQ